MHRRGVGGRGLHGCDASGKRDWGLPIFITTPAARRYGIFSAWPPAWIRWWWANRRSWGSSRRPTAAKERRRAERLAGRACDAGLRRRQARPHRDRRGPDGGFGELRGGGTGAQESSARQSEQDHDRGRREDERTGRAPPAPVGRLPRLRHQPHLRARRRYGEAVSGHAGGMGALPCHAAGGGYPDRLHRGRRVHPAQEDMQG